MASTQTTYTKRGSPPKETHYMPTHKKHTTPLTPKLRQIMLAKEMVAHPGQTLKKSLANAGYAPSTAASLIIKTPSFQALLKQYLPDDELLIKHKEFLNAPRLIREYRKGDVVSEVTETDPSAVRALDLAYKITGKYRDKLGGNNTLVINVSDGSASRFAPIQVEAKVIEPQENYGDQTDPSTGDDSDG